MFRTICYSTLLTLLLASASSAASITSFTSQAAFQSATNTTAELDFTGFQQFEPLTNQYSSFGVTFTDGDDRIENNNAFVDGSGAAGGVSFDISFDASYTAIGFTFPGILVLDLYQDNTMVGSSATFGGGGIGFFGGVVSDMAFNRVVAFDNDRFSFIDGIILGDPIRTDPPSEVPLPASALLLFAGMASFAGVKKIYAKR